jgi:hypothetical protein
MPKVRRVHVRLDGNDTDVLQVAELLTLLPGLMQDRVQVDEPSRSYPNRRGPGVRRYLDVYVLDEPPTVTATAGEPTSSAGELDQALEIEA